MRKMEDATCIQVEITNFCPNSCQSCTRFCGKIKKPYFMDVDKVEEALLSLEGFPNWRGCMGGEPTAHPEFEAICKLYQKHVPKHLRGLWTMGLNWSKYEQIIRETFPLENILYNDHSEDTPGNHQQLLIASAEIIPDQHFLWELVDNCWIANRWSPSININGGYFCEVAAAQSLLFGDNTAFKIEPGWWKRTPVACTLQLTRHCTRCSACIPFGDQYKHGEYVTHRNRDWLVVGGEAKNIDRLQVVSPNYYTREDYERNKANWHPGVFRSFEQHEPGVRVYKCDYCGGTGYHPYMPRSPTNQVNSFSCLKCHGTGRREVKV